MSLKVVPAPGTPAAELLELSEREAELARREASLLEGGAETEALARAVQSRLDEARGSLQRLASSPVHSEAESAFLRSLGMVVPAHVATSETGAAIALRRQALAVRESALAAEEATVHARLAGLGALDQQIAELRALAAALAQRAQLEVARAREAAARQAASQVIDLTHVKVRPGAPHPTAAPVQATVQAPATQPAPAPAPAPRPADPGPLAAQPARSPAPASPAPAAGLPAASKAELRRAPRLKLQAEVSLSSESNFFTGFSGDISETGVFVATYESVLAPGSDVQLTLRMPNRPPLEVAGRVRWVRESSDRTPGVFPGMGIEFQNLSEQDVSAIKDFLRRREPMFWAE